MIDIQAYVNFAILGFMIIINSVVLIRVRFKIERWGAIIIFTYFLSAILRVVQQISILTLKNDPYSFEFLDEFVELSEMINWTVLYYVIFEIQMLRERIESDSHTIYLSRQKGTLNERRFVISFLIIMFSIVFAFYLYFVTKSNYFYESTCPLNLTMLGFDFACQGLEMLSDLYMGHKFISHFLFFLKIKLLKLEEVGLSLSSFNIFMIFWLFFLVLLNMICSITRPLFAPLVENRLIGSTDPNFAYQWETLDLWLLNVFIPFTDLFTQLTFLYLFYFQAIAKINAEKESASAGGSVKAGSRIISLEETRKDIRQLYKKSNSIKQNKMKNNQAVRQKYSLNSKN